MALAVLCAGPCGAQQPDTTTATGPAPAAAPVTVLSPDVEAPRPFGHVLGDVVTQRVALDHDGRPLNLPGLPPLERTGNWFERRNARIEHDATGRRWLVLDYQIINVPEELRAIDLPALDLPTTVDGQRLQTASLPLTVAPLTPTVVLARAGLEEMRPDADAPHIDTAALERRLHLALAAAATLAAGWIALLSLRRWRAGRRLPFSRAQREMRRLDAGSSAAWRRLHRALDETAGQVVRGHSLATLLLRAPWLVPIEGELRLFFEASQARFFAEHPGDDADPAALCARAARLERKALA
jgi:mxaA protein